MSKIKKNKTIILAAISVCLIILIIWILWANTALEINTHVINSDNLPESFSGFRIAQVSDLHNANFGEENEILLEKLKETNPDIIVITGDLVDSRNTDIEVGIEFAKKAVEIAPTYYVTGNHESRISEYGTLKEGLLDAGVVVLENERVELERAGEKIVLLGVDDPSFQTSYLFGDSASVTDSALQELTDEENAYTILLAHRPELFKTYVENDVDLVFCGHAHGGQFRLPFVGGLVAPNQGFFPKYDAGFYMEDNTTMVVSRGIGNSILPLRINNRPEIVVIELSKR